MQVEKKKILGIDYGDFTIGLAIFDLGNDFIYPYKTIFRKKANVLRKSIREIVDIIKVESITDIVIGLPLNTDGTEGDRVEKVKSFANMLKNGIVNSQKVAANNAVGVSDIVGAKPCDPNRMGELHEPQIYFQDERLTTVEAKSILAEHKVKKEDWKKTVDQIAAEIILQDFRQSNYK